MERYGALLREQPEEWTHCKRWWVHSAAFKDGSTPTGHDHQTEIHAEESKAYIEGWGLGRVVEIRPIGICNDEYLRAAGIEVHRA